eukprot:CAMPEP_0119016358 /NCGR_PEP_ID=MMETSP1176-20130426/12428_1 /TAXON_ID=265551 /ORGANISM="Synedropsis recta cf, Strain CCMP1620" /LENGTH=270 /DNA_ID=CAMNT_0006969733 /DNA_START=290 /DNA_END=1102 /DNA_ORIENTATION=-
MEIDNDPPSSDEDDASSTNSYAITTFVTEDEEYSEDEMAYKILHQHKEDRSITLDAGNTEEKVGFKRFPCKARNVGDTHTRDTAFIELPHDATHGLQLYCSHPECSGSGRAFRWCNVCEVVVAKRNFVKRHSHGLLPICRTHMRKHKKKVAPKPPLKKSKAITRELTAALKGGSSSSAPPKEDELSTESNTGAHAAPLLEESVSKHEEIMPPITPSCSHILTTAHRQSVCPPRKMTVPPSKIFPDDEDASIEAIGNLMGWNETYIDSIFD